MVKDPQSVRHPNHSSVPVSPATDTVVGAYGKFGYARTSPIPVYGPAGECEYLARLRCGCGEPFVFHRLGGAGSGPDGHLLDKYELVCRNREHRIALYLDRYHAGSSLRVPDGLARSIPRGVGSPEREAGFPDTLLTPMDEGPLPELSLFDNAASAECPLRHREKGTKPAASAARRGGRTDSTPDDTPTAVSARESCCGNQDRRKSTPPRDGNRAEYGDASESCLPRVALTGRCGDDTPTVLSPRFIGPLDGRAGSSPLPEATTFGSDSRESPVARGTLGETSDHAQERGSLSTAARRNEAGRELLVEEATSSPGPRVRVSREVRSPASETGEGLVPSAVPARVQASPTPRWAGGNSFHVTIGRVLVLVLMLGAGAAAIGHACRRVFREASTGRALGPLEPTSSDDRCAGDVIPCQPQMRSRSQLWGATSVRPEVRLSVLRPQAYRPTLSRSSRLVRLGN